MNSKARNLFQMIQTAASIRRDATLQALEDYVKERDEARRIASKFKDEQGEYSARQSLIAETARERIRKAGHAFDSSLQDAISGLKRELSLHLGGAKVNPDFTRELAMVRDFHLKPSRAEVEHLVELTGGNAFSLTALNAVLKENKTAFRLKYTATEDFEKDLLQLEALRGMIYIPLAVSHDGLEIFQTEQQVFRRPDGQTFMDGRKYDGISLHVARTVFESTLKDAAKAMPERWATAATYPAIDEVTETEAGGGDGKATETEAGDGDSKVGTADATYGSEVITDRSVTGHRLGADRARKQAVAEQIVSRYTE
ncbi:MAG: hypothetical protein E7325_01035 [Clostridiales bacterium]|nr:hypothetical protein [Clostridiales bacterium]